MQTLNSLLKLEAVSKDYPAAEGAAPVCVLREITLEVPRGASVAIMGPSGSGKSTLLNIMGTLDRPSRGRVLLNGIDLAGLNEAGLAAVRNQHIGFVFQAHHLLPHCTTLENVLVPTLARSRTDVAEGGKPGSPSSKPEAPEARARRLLERVGLGQRLDHRPGRLSGGERQRVAVVRALINQPELLLADEPTGALDRAAATDLGQLLVDLNREEGVTLVVVTHARELARRMGVSLELREGALSRVEPEAP